MVVLLKAVTVLSLSNCSCLCAGVSQLIQQIQLKTLLGDELSERNDPRGVAAGMHLEAQGIGG